MEQLAVQCLRTAVVAQVEPHDVVSGREQRGPIEMTLPLPRAPPSRAAAPRLARVATGRGRCPRPLRGEAPEFSAIDDPLFRARRNRAIATAPAGSRAGGRAGPTGGGDSPARLVARKRARSGHRGGPQGAIRGRRAPRRGCSAAAPGFHSPAVTPSETSGYATAPRRRSRPAPRRMRRCHAPHGGRAFRETDGRRRYRAASTGARARRRH